MITLGSVPAWTHRADLYASHRQAHVASHVGRVLHMYNGRNVMEAPSP